MHPTIRLMSMIIVLISSALWLLVAVFAKDLSMWLRGLFVTIGIIAVIMMTFRDTYLPFLGYTAYPTQTLAVTPLLTNANASVRLSRLPPKTKVVWWASNAERTNSDTVIPGPKTAYADSANAGVVLTDAQGGVVIHLWCPQSYKVGLGKVLPKHIHYRFEQTIEGHKTFLSRVHTALVQCA